MSETNVPGAGVPPTPPTAPPPPAQGAQPVQSMAAPAQQTVTGPVPTNYGAPNAAQFAAPGAPSAYYGPRPKGFFGRLFDMSFEKYESLTIFNVTYIVSLVAIWGTWLYKLIVDTVVASDYGDINGGDYAYIGLYDVLGVSGGAVGVFFTVFLLGGIIAFVLSLWVRLVLEFFVTTKRKADNADRLRELKEQENK